MQKTWKLITATYIYCSHSYEGHQQLIQKWALNIARQAQKQRLFSFGSFVGRLLPFISVITHAYSLSKKIKKLYTAPLLLIISWSVVLHMSDEQMQIKGSKKILESEEKRLAKMWLPVSMSIFSSLRLFRPRSSSSWLTLLPVQYKVLYVGNITSSLSDMYITRENKINF